MYEFKKLERKYGIKIIEDGIGLYKIYSADGCLWENGLTKTLVKKECKEWNKQLLNIKSKKGE